MPTEVKTPKAEIMDMKDFLENGMLREKEFRQKLSQIRWEDFRDRKVIVKGCDNIPVPIWAYMAVVANLAPYASRIFWGEPCSAVPVFVRKA